MAQPVDQLPDDIAALKALVADQMARNAELERTTTRQSAQIISLQEQLNLALARRYAASSEKLSPDQIRLFDEAEVDAGESPGEETSEQLDIVPAKIQVIRHAHKRYACECGQCIRTAPLPAQPIPKSLASPGLLAHITVSKYQDALPLYRQETILQRTGVDLPRATLANWMIRAGQLVQPLINLMRDQLLVHDLIQMDETTVQVLKESGKAAQSKSYLWLQRGGPPDHPVVLYDYDPGRGQAVPLRLLEGFRGYLQTDGYDGYNAVVAAQQLTHVGCMAHARRKFSEAVKTQVKNKKAGRAKQGLALIQKLYRVESEARGLTPERRHAVRLEKAVPVLEQLRAWLDKSLPQGHQARRRARPCSTCTTSGASWSPI